MKPTIAVTMGDPAGIGPEVIARAASNRQVRRVCRLLAVGDAERLQHAARLCGLPLCFQALSGLPEDPKADDPGTVPCLQAATVPENLAWGKVDARAGDAAYRSVAAAVDLALRGRVDAVCTAPLNKEALHQAGHRYPGHTELLATLTGATDVAMLLWSPRLRVVHVTTHVGLADAILQVTPDRVQTVLELGEQFLHRIGIPHPRIAVCGLNPHAGENGLFGHGEESERILPAVARARAGGMAVYGPLPADSLFPQAAQGAFDLVVAMYHDQGHIPVKLLGINHGVNVTLGLPLLRTSVDHGTAFDIAGQGTAAGESMVAAIRLAARLAHTRQRGARSG